MNKKEVCVEVSSRLGCPAQTVRQVATTLFEVIGDVVVSGEDVTIRGFGSFEKSVRKNRWTYDFKNGKSVFVGDEPCIKFFPSKNIIEKMREDIYGNQ